MSSTKYAFATAAALLWFSPAMAYDQPANDAMGGIPMISGGIGDSEEGNIMTLQKNYNLKLLFTEGNGMYLSDVQVRILSKGQEVANTITNGPILLAKLPAGQYTVEAVSNGETRTQRIAVGGGLKTYQIRYTTRDTE